jgi:DNA-binding CsgD family transcriptional regulator
LGLATMPAYLLVGEGRVPTRWRPRARWVALIPLLPEEVSSLAAGEEARLTLDPQEERIASLLARGLSVSVIARELGEPLRTVQRRLARLRDRVGVRSTSELAVLLAARGFGAGESRPSRDAGEREGHVEGPRSRKRR